MDSIIRLITSAPYRICPFPAEALPIISPVSILINNADTVVVPISIARPPITTLSDFGYTSYTKISPSSEVRITQRTSKLLSLNTLAIFVST